MDLEECVFSLILMSLGLRLAYRYTQKHVFEYVNLLRARQETVLINFERPLDIHDSVYRRSDAYLAKEVNLVAPEQQSDGSLRFKPAPFTLPINPKTCGGGGGLHMSAGSYIKLLQSLLNDGVYAPTGKRILKKETVDLLFAPQYTNDKESKYGNELRAWLHVDTDPFHRSPRNGGPKEVPHRRRGFGLGCILTLEDLPGGRAAGTLMASGFG